jgi:glycosyltransferase involved in cell wall biosynthesis
VPHADTRAWARAIEHLLDDPAFAARLAAAGRRKVLESYTFAATLARTEAVYRAAIAERTRSRLVTA